MRTGEGAKKEIRTFCGCHMYTAPSRRGREAIAIGRARTTSSGDSANDLIYQLLALLILILRKSLTRRRPLTTAYSHVPSIFAHMLCCRNEGPGGAASDTLGNVVLIIIAASCDHRRGREGGQVDESPLLTTSGTSEGKLGRTDRQAGDDSHVWVVGKYPKN